MFPALVLVGKENDEREKSADDPRPHRIQPRGAAGDGDVHRQPRRPEGKSVALGEVVAGERAPQTGEWPSGRVHRPPAGDEHADGEVVCAAGADAVHVVVEILPGQIEEAADGEVDAAALAVVGVAAFLAMLMMLGPGLAVLESAGPVRAVHRSVQLVLPRWVRVAGLMLLVLVINVGIALILGLVVTVLIHLVNPNSVATFLAWVVNPLLGVVFLIVGAGLVCSLYADLRTREAEGEGTPGP